MTARSEGGVERLDLDAYLERIGFGGDPRPDLDTLIGLHRAHVTSIPFENLDVVLGREISLELDALQAKLVRQQRGGYCYEHGLLFAAALERIGFTLTRLVARVQPGTPGPRSHMLSRALIDGMPWLADVGYGAGLLEPIALESGTTVDQDGWGYRLERYDDGAWLVAAGHGQEWAQLYAFTLEPQRPIDYVVVNHFTQTHPGSPFVGQPVVFDNRGDARHRLTGLELTIEWPDGNRERRALAAGELGETLRDVFDIILSGTDLATLRSRAQAR